MFLGGVGRGARRGGISVHSLCHCLPPQSWINRNLLKQFNFKPFYDEFFLRYLRRRRQCVCAVTMPRSTHHSCNCNFICTPTHSLWLRKRARVYVYKTIKDIPHMALMHAHTHSERGAHTETNANRLQAIIKCICSYFVYICEVIQSIVHLKSSSFVIESVVMCSSHCIRRASSSSQPNYRFINRTHKHTHTHERNNYLPRESRHCSSVVVSLGSIHIECNYVLWITNGQRLRSRHNNQNRWNTSKCVYNVI